MKSAVALTKELDDAKKAAGQLAEAIRGRLTFERHAVGLLFCDSDMDGATVTGELGEILGCEVAGMTALAVFGPEGRHDAAAVLTVLTAQDCTFIATMSSSLADDGRKDAIADTCRRLVRPDDGKAPGLALTFCPFAVRTPGDVYPAVFAKHLPGVPMIGGVASDGYDLANTRTFLSGRESADAMVAVGLHGEVHPSFALRHVTSHFAERLRRVTESSGNVVRRIGDQTVVQYLESVGLKTDVTDPLLAFAAYPLMLIQDTGVEETPVMRHIAAIDHGTGAVTFVGDVPEGVLANVCMVTRQDLEASCRESSASLLAEPGAAPGDASTVLCFSCFGRATLLGQHPNAEGDILARMLPEGMALSGAYCLGEISPTGHGRDGIRNRFHNCSIAFCLL
ncbi:MAG: FIST C-terminal domain-containing protein [Desulfovibrio sp.]|jgi:hypothetical protein|nr:FIST C-terminal domain-containing protein [Desulfovibrio sp.]